MNKEYNMNKKLKVHNPEGSEYKYSDVGNIRPNNSGNDMIGIMVSRIEPAIQAAKDKAAREGKDPSKVWLNIMMFDDNPQQNTAQQQHSVAKGNAYVEDDVEDEIPFS